MHKINVCNNPFKLIRQKLNKSQRNLIQNREFKKWQIQIDIREMKMIPIMKQNFICLAKINTFNIKCW